MAIVFFNLMCLPGPEPRRFKFFQRKCTILRIIWSLKTYFVIQLQKKYYICSKNDIFDVCRVQ